MSLIKVGKSSFKLAVLLFFGLGIVFLGLKNTKAEENQPNVKVVISGVYYNHGGTDAGQEWIQIYNIGDEINLNNYQLGTSSSYYTFSNVVLKSRDSLTIHWNTEGNDSSTDLYTGAGFNNMSSTKGSVALFNNKTRSKLTIIDYLEYGAAGQTWESAAVSAGIWTMGTFILNAPTGYSLERNPIDQDTNTISDFVIQPQIFPPLSPTDLSPITGQIFTFQNDLNFSWKGDTNTAEYEFILFNNHNIIILDEDLINANYQISEDLDYGTYYWQVIAKNELYESAPSQASFILQEPVYSSAIIINEIMPNPAGDDNTGEWIELYNNSNETVDLSGWILQDARGTIHQYRIPNNTLIQPFSYFLLYRNVSGITLNNDVDGIYLFWPNGLNGTPLSQTMFLENAPEGLSWARGPTGEWLWTTTPTPGTSNIITTMPEPSSSIIDEPPINTVPIEIYTGDYQDFLGKLVKIRGKVISTSGNTFYIDDGSGVVKVYIQDKTGILKPSMHKNDIFEIVGVVDLYGQTWRILPRFLDDIKLIERAAAITTKKVTVKKVTNSIVASATKPVVGKAVAAAQTTSPPKDEDKTNSLNQIIKTLIGLAVLGLIFLIIKIFQRSKEKTSRQLGGHFGDDFT